MGVRSQSLWMEISKQEGVWGSFLWSIEPFLWGSKFDSPESHQAQPITTAYQHKRLGFPALKIRKIFLVLMSVLYPLLIPLYLCHSFPWPVSALIHAKNRCCQYQQPCVLPRVSRIWGGGRFSSKIYGSLMFVPPLFPSEVCSHLCPLLFHASPLNCLLCWCSFSRSFLIQCLDFAHCICAAPL